MKKRWQKWRRSLKRKSGGGLVRRVFLVGVALVVLASAWGLYQAGAYLYDLPGLRVDGISVSGVTRVSEGEILARAGFAAGSSILSLDLDRIRVSIESLPWVRHARVQRVWPREIVVAVIERSPIALARVEGQFYQVDVEGVLLPVDGLAVPDSPILDGLRIDDAEGNRTRVETYRRTVELIGEDALSEVHIDGNGAVSVVPSASPILVDLGEEQHLERWQRYLQLSGRILRDFPGAMGVDVRFEDRVIIRQAGEQPVRSLPWEEEARLL